MKTNKQLIKEFLEIIGNQRDNFFRSYITIRNAIDLFSIPFGTIPIRANTPLFRCRLHENPDQLFTKVSDLSHRTDLMCIKKFGRANEPLQSIFYCSTDRETALYETSQIEKSKGKIQIESITYGKWILQKDINVAHLPIVAGKIGINPIADQLHNTFERIVKEMANEDTSDWRKVIDFFSLEFSRESSGTDIDYLVSCAFANYVYSIQCEHSVTKKKMFMDGITYPSVRYSEVGMNLALLPQLLIDGILKLETVIFQKMEKVNSSTFLETETKISKSIDPENDYILW
jgi:hypothetical protein